MKRIIYILLVLSACSTKNKDKNVFSIKPLVINTDTSESFGGDVKLSIAGIKYLDTSTIYNLISTYEGKKVGFDVNVPLNKDNLAFIRLKITSTGESSNAFINILAKIYKLKSDSNLKFVNTISPAFRNLNDEHNVVKSLKLFFESESGDEDAEVFLDLNEKDGWAELAEKDKDYRPLIIKFLTHKDINNQQLKINN